MIVFEGPRLLALLSGLGVARPRSESRLLPCPGACSWRTCCVPYLHRGGQVSRRGVPRPHVSWPSTRPSRIITHGGASVKPGDGRRGPRAVEDFLLGPVGAQVQGERPGGGGQPVAPQFVVLGRRAGGGQGQRSVGGV